MRIAYIGLKPTKTDNVAGTGLTWVAGQEHEVANLGACAKLLRATAAWWASSSSVLNWPSAGSVRANQIVL